MYLGTKLIFLALPNYKYFCFMITMLYIPRSEYITIFIDKNKFIFLFLNLFFELIVTIYDIFRFGKLTFG